MSVNQIALSTPHYQTPPSEEKGQVAPVESVESRVQKILSEIFGRYIAQIIWGYHRLRNITSLPPILNDGRPKEVDLSYAEISNSTLLKCSWDINHIIFDGSIFTEQIDLSRFKELRFISASESNEAMINWQKCPRGVIRCELNRCDLSSVLNQLPMGLITLCLEESHFVGNELYRLQKLESLSLTQDSFCKIDFRKLGKLERLFLIHDGEKPFEADFSDLFNQLSEIKLRWLTIHGYIVKGANFSKLPSSIRSMEFIRVDLRRVDMSCFPSNLHRIILDTCALNRDSLTQLPKNVNEIQVGDFDLREVDFDHLPHGVETMILDRCIFDQKSLFRFPEGLREIFFHRLDFTQVSFSQFSEKTKSLNSICTFGKKRFSLLSEGLKKLSFKGCNFIDVVFFKLPQGLEYVYFHDCNLKNAYVFLPKGIKQIQFYFCDCTNINFSLFPESFEKIVFYRCKDKKGGFSQFPRHIEVLRIPKYPS